MSEDNTNTEPSHVENSERLSIAIQSIMDERETDSLLLISESKDGELYTSYAPGDNGTGPTRSESGLIAEYIRFMSQRSGKDVESVVREIISELNKNGGGGE